MPNWCINKLDISGPKKDVKRFRAQACGPTQSYNSFSSSGEAWPLHDDIRVNSLISHPPEPGDSVDFSFHALYPVPVDFRCFPYDDQRAKELGETVGQERPYGGYTWESRHWGCKWGGCDTQLISSGSGRLQYDFSTPWGPPIEFFEKIAEDWPTLNFMLSYEEPGMGFRGESHWEEGSLVFEHTEEYEEDGFDEE